MVTNNIPNIGFNPYLYTFPQYSAFGQQQQAAVPTSDEDSLNLGSGMVSCTVLMTAPYWGRPINSFRALTETWRDMKAFAELNPELYKNLSGQKLGEIWNTFYKSNRAQNLIAGRRLADGTRAGKGVSKLFSRAARSAEESVQVAKEVEGFGQKTVDAIMHNGSGIEGAAEKAAAETSERAAKASLDAAIDTGKKHLTSLSKGSKTAAETASAGTAAGEKVVADAAKETVSAGAETAAAAGTEKAATGVFGKLTNWGKDALKKGGYKMMFGIDLAMECLTNVYPAFRDGGAGEGFKQLGKSAVHAVGTSVGWILGEAAGTAIFAGIGKWLGGLGGSVFGPVGTFLGSAIGGFIGKMVGGLIGSWFGGRAAKAVTGKSFTEQQAEKAATANNNPFGTGIPSFGMGFPSFGSGFQNNMMNPFNQFMPNGLC